ncbi:MAG TPA: GAD-like domain-containing protein [Gemmatimonadaceae bacterium]|jgi:hypothetical protein|nr:GAD-like domain-containing protein [Gemmatimonadaceae bacterium]
MTSLADLPQFTKVHKKVRSYQPCPPELVQKYRGRLPEILVETWERFGFQEFSDGFLWSVNPDEFRDVISEFLYDYQSEFVDVVFRTAMGDMIIAYKGELVHFSAVTMRHGRMTGSLESVLEMDLGQPQFLKSIFFFDLFKIARKKLGSLSPDEMYGLVPPVSLGGEITPENLQKVDLRRHLHDLARSQTRP